MTDPTETPIEEENTDHGVDFAQLSSAQLKRLHEEVAAERKRRQVIDNAETTVNDLANKFFEASGILSGDPWRQPAGAHDAYPLGWQVTHTDKVWESLIAANVWEPGVSGWREIVTETEEPEAPNYAAWVQPTGAHDAYDIGDRVTYNGNLWQSTNPGNVWMPGVYGWSIVAQ